MQNYIHFVSSLFVLAITSVSGVNQVSNGIHQSVLKLRAQLANKVYPNSSKLHEFIQDDLYIFRWLDLSNLDVVKAQKRIMDHLAWREAEKVDTIHLEDWSLFQEEYPLYIDTFDKHGRPVAEQWKSDWDIRAAYMSGRLHQLVRWAVYLVEMSQRRLHQIRKIAGNKNVTGGALLNDMEGFNTHKQACIPCTTFLINLGKIADQQYPRLWEKIYMVNVGQLFRQFLTGVNTNYDYNSHHSMKLYTSRSEWLPVLDREMDKSQRSKRFGGSLSRA